MKTFVSVGNAFQPFNRLLDAVSVNVSLLPQPVTIQHGHTPFSCIGCTAVQFMEMQEFSRTVESSELLIMHAGAGSVIHAVRAGKVPVIMPRVLKYGEHIDDHQIELARALARTGKVVLVENPSDLEQAVSQALTRQKASNISSEVPDMVGMIEKTFNDIATQINN